LSGICLSNAQVKSDHSTASKKHDKIIQEQTLLYQILLPAYTVG